MSTLRAIKQSNVARYGTYLLVVLLHVIYVLGRPLQFGFGGAGLRQQATRFVAASVVFLLALMLLRWFFEAKTGETRRRTLQPWPSGRRSAEP